MEAVGYCIRIDARENYSDKIRALVLCPDYTAIAGIKHKGNTGENPHYHLVIRTGLKDQALRVRLRKIFDQGKGNQHMSMKQWDGNSDAISYLFHEDAKADLFVKKNITDEFIEACRARNVRVQEAVKEAKKSASHTLEEDVYQMITRGDIKVSTYAPDVEKEVAMQVVLVALRNGKYVPNDYLLRGIVSRIVFRLQGGDEEKEERFAARLVSRVYRFD